MKIIQVIDLDGTTVKVDETNPSEPKIVAALQFDLAMRKNVAIGDIAELVFAKPVNANVEAVCIGYKGTDGKHYGLVDDMFATVEPTPEPTPEPAPVERNSFIELTIPSDYAGNPELRVLPNGSSRDSNFDRNELYAGADLTNGIYAIIGTDRDTYHFTHVSTGEDGVHTLRADKVYRTPLSSELYVQFGTTATEMSYGGTLRKIAESSDYLDYAGGTFRLDSKHHTQTALSIIDHL